MLSLSAFNLLYEYKNNLSYDQQPSYNSYERFGLLSTKCSKKTMQIDPSLQILKNYTWLHILKLLLRIVYLKCEQEALITLYYKLGNQQ